MSVSARRARDTRCRAFAAVIPSCCAISSAAAPSGSRGVRESHRRCARAGPSARRRIRRRPSTVRRRGVRSRFSATSLGPGLRPCCERSRRARSTTNGTPYPEHRSPHARPVGRPFVRHRRHRPDECLTKCFVDEDEGVRFRASRPMRPAPRSNQTLPRRFLSAPARHDDNESWGEGHQK
jgi:hypothetical protein